MLSLIQNLYESIKNEPFKIPEDDGNDLTHTFFNPDREGWLLKLGECGPPARGPVQKRSTGVCPLAHGCTCCRTTGGSWRHCGGTLV